MQPEGAHPQECQYHIVVGVGDRMDWQHLEEMQDRIWNQSLIQQEMEQQSIHAKAVSMEFGTAAAAAVCPASSWERFDLGQVQLVSPEGKRDWKL